MTTVGRRMAEILRPDDVTPAENEGATFATVHRVMRAHHQLDGGDPLRVERDPHLPAEVAERIRERLRAGDLEGAADIASKVFASLGLEAPKGGP